MKGRFVLNKQILSMIFPSICYITQLPPRKIYDSNFLGYMAIYLSSFVSDSCHEYKTLGHSESLSLFHSINVAATSWLMMVRTSQVANACEILVS